VAVSRRNLIATALAAPAATLARPSALRAQSAGQVAFVYEGAIDDLGWNAAIDAGRQALAASMPGVETVVEENVGVPRADAESALRRLAAGGARAIFAASAGYTPSALAAAVDFPDTAFVVIGDILPPDRPENVGSAFAWIEEPRYVAGMLAGRMTREDRLGYVIALPTPRALRSLNAFVLGARAVNPEVVVEPYWTFLDTGPDIEYQATGWLVQNGADIVAQSSADFGAPAFAAELDAYSIGFGGDTSAAAPDAVLTSVLWDWAPYLERTVGEIMDGSWLGDAVVGGWADGMVGLGPIAPAVRTNVREEIEAAIATFADGSRTIDDVFAGPISDSAGELRVPEGSSLSVDELLTMDWAVEGVEGDLPGQ